MTATLPQHPKSSAQYAESFAALHKLIANFASANKDSLGRGFAYNEFPDSVLSFISLEELKTEGAGLIGINEDLYAELVELLETYNIDAEYVSVIRAERDGIMRFIVQTGSLDENAWEEIISEEEIRQRDAERLKVRAAKHIADLKADRASKKKANGKRKR